MLVLLALAAAAATPGAAAASQALPILVGTREGKVVPIDLSKHSGFTDCQ